MTHQKNSFSIQLIIIAGLVVVALMFFKYASAVYKDYEVETEIKDLQVNIADLKKKNTELEGLIEYLDTDSYKEIVAKRELNLKRPGEIVIAIKDTEEGQTSEEIDYSTEVDYSRTPIYQKWYNLFFDSKNT